MSGKRVALLVTVRGASTGSDGSGSKVTNAWVYVEKQDTVVLLRADANGDVLQFTEGGGRADDPKSYTTLFATEEGTELGVAFSTDAKPLSDAQIRIRLKRVKVVATTGFSTRNVKEVAVNGQGTKQNVEAVVRGKVEVEPFAPHKAARAIAAISFGKPQGKKDIHADAMDRFLLKNYGQPGVAPKHFTRPPDVFPGVSPRPALDELRRTVRASGSEGLDMIRDIGTAAKALSKDDAVERVVSLVSHGFFGQKDPELSRGGSTGILESNFTQISKVRKDIVLAEKAKKKAIENDDLPEVQAATAEIERLKSSPAGQFAAALDEAAAALADANVKVVELQACNAGGDEAQVGSIFGIESRLQENLSTRTHKIEVRGHAKLISTHIEAGAVFLGSDLDDASDDVAQYSKDTLPVPAP